MYTCDKFNPSKYSECRKEWCRHCHRKKKIDTINLLERFLGKGNCLVWLKVQTPCSNMGLHFIVAGLPLTVLEQQKAVNKAVPGKCTSSW